MRDVLMTRRTAIHSGLIGLAAAYGLSGCGDDDEPSGGGGEGGGGAPTGNVTFGSNYSDEVPKQALQASLDAYQQQSGGVTVGLNTVEHETFQEQINNYLQGDPDDVFSWFAGYRMQFFAERGLATEIDDVWQEIGGEYSEAFKAQSKGLDGKYYFVPF